jgi:hypothetical protein
MRAQHDAHLMQLRAAADRAREAEHAPLPDPPELNAEASAHLKQLAERHARVASEVDRAAASARELADRQAELAKQLDSVIALEARPCVTQQLIGVQSAKGLAAGYAPTRLRASPPRTSVTRLARDVLRARDSPADIPPSLDMRANARAPAATALRRRARSLACWRGRSQRERACAHRGCRIAVRPGWRSSRDMGPTCRS